MPWQKRSLKKALKANSKKTATRTAVQREQEQRLYEQALLRGQRSGLKGKKLEGYVERIMKQFHESKK